MSAMAQEAGVPEGTLYHWSKVSTLGAMSAECPDHNTPAKLAQQ